MCQKVGEEYVPVNDGAKIYYANTAINDGSDKAELLALFLKKQSFDSRKFPALSQAMRYFKEDERGVKEVCTVVEEYAEEQKRIWQEK